MQTESGHYSIGVIKDFGNLGGLGRLRIAHHGLGSDELHKGELAIDAKSGS